MASRRGTMSTPSYIAAFGLACLLLSHTQAQESVEPSVKEPALRLELLQRVKQDKAIRDELIRKGAANPDRGILERMETIDQANTARVREIVRQHGWPS